MIPASGSPVSYCANKLRHCLRSPWEELSFSFSRVVRLWTDHLIPLRDWDVLEMGFRLYKGFSISGLPLLLRYSPSWELIGFLGCLLGVFLFSWCWCLIFVSPNSYESLSSSKLFRFLAVTLYLLSRCFASTNTIN